MFLGDTIYKLLRWVNIHGALCCTVTQKSFPIFAAVTGISFLYHLKKCIKNLADRSLKKASLNAIVTAISGGSFLICINAATLKTTGLYND